MSFAHLEDNDIKFGQGAKGSTRGLNTKITTQALMGVLTKNILMKVLRNGLTQKPLPLMAASDQ